MTKIPQMIQTSSATHTQDLREQINVFLEQRNWAEAHRALGDLWRQKNLAAAPYILSCHEKMKAHLALTECRIGFLRSLTLEPLIPALRSAAFIAGIDATVQVGQFNMYAQEILDPKSALYSFEPNIVVLAIQTRDILPELWEGYADLPESQVHAAVQGVHDSFANWVKAFRKNSNASLLIHTLEKPLASAGALDAQSANGQLSAIDRVNEGLRKIAAENRGVYVLDYEALVAKHGRVRWHDEAKWLTMRMPFATDSMLPLVTEWLKFIHPLTGKICKVLAVDLDNTLWSGVLGEDGAEGIRMDAEYPGAFNRNVQRAILDLHQRGILLALCSKNNQDEAMAVLKDHRDMLLRPEHFAAFRINWQDKAQNIREIAAELNLGIDSIAFLDDNPVERQRVRTDLPEVKVIEVPGHAKGFAQALRDFPYFERLVLSEEDRKLTSLYHEQNQRAELAHSAGSLEDFYRSLHQEVVIAPATVETISRVAQLTQKTNQYNVTTRRYTEQQIEEFVSQPGWGV